MCPTFTHLFRKMVFKSLQKKIAHDSLLLNFENHGEILEKGLFSPYNLLEIPIGLAKKKSAPPHHPDAGTDRDTFPASSITSWIFFPRNWAPFQSTISLSEIRQKGHQKQRTKRETKRSDGVLFPSQKHAEKKW